MLSSFRLMPRAVFVALVVAACATIAPASRPVVQGPQASGASEAATQCPPGFFAESEAGRGKQDIWAKFGMATNARSRLLALGCRPNIGVEPYQEIVGRDAQWGSLRSAPFASVHPEAQLAGAMQRQAMLANPAAVPGNSRRVRPYGVGPLNFDDPRYPSVNGSGIVDATGRIDDFDYDAEHNRLFSAIGTGGVWMSEDLGANWVPITDKLPTTAVSSLAYTPAGGPEGTLIVLTGEHTYGSFALTGLGAFYTTDLGATWKRAYGVPNGTLGFAVEVDPGNPNIVYAATGKGLRRSTDAGRTFIDVRLPTGQCTARYGAERCAFANFVTDVVVQAPGGAPNVRGGTVVAAVGWRAGRHRNPDGTIQSDGNGIYRSPTGARDTFERLPGLENLVGRNRVGRIELGATVGPQQDHRYLYALVQDAVLLMGGPSADGLPNRPSDLGANPTVLNGVYVSANFGESWILLADDHELSDSCLINRSVYCIPGLVEPGAQAWYNMWIEPDPTKQVGGIPSRVLMGLEEVWQTRGNTVPQNTPATSFEVVGAYYGSVDCLLIATNCLANKRVGTKTTHPDQHAGIFIPQADGSVKLIVGNDGGVATQTATQVDDFDQSSWNLIQENGLYTLLPYSSVWANDGVAYAGLQDNGHMRLSPEEGYRQFETYGADGTFAAVDPNNSNYVWESTQNAGLQVSVDGGKTWRGAKFPDAAVRFVNPFVMDPLDPNHLVSGGNTVFETVHGPDTGRTGKTWTPVFNLGTAPIPDLPPWQLPAGVPPKNALTAVDTRGDASYVGFCGPCDILNTGYPFTNGIATNVSDDEKLPQKGTSDGWHFVPAEGLPNRFITSIAIDPQDATQETIYVTLGGYHRRWTPPGTAGNPSYDVGEGHVFKSTDAGRTFVDISGNLPDLPALWVEPRGSQLLVGSDVGAFISSDSAGTKWAPLGYSSLPSTAVTSIQLQPNDPNKALLGLYGRGLWIYEFPRTAPQVPTPPAPTPRLGEPIEDVGGPQPIGEVLAGPYGWESDAEGWTVETKGTASTSWARGAPGYESDTGFNIPRYDDFAETTLTSPQLSSPGGRVFASWWTKYDVEGGGYDDYRLEFSTNGQDWYTLGVFGGQNFDYPEYTRQQVSFLTEAGNYFLRFRFYSDFICASTPTAPGICARPDGYKGVFVDEVTIKR